MKREAVLKSTQNKFCLKFTSSHVGDTHSTCGGRRSGQKRPKIILNCLLFYLSWKSSSDSIMLVFSRNREADGNLLHPFRFASSLPVSYSAGWKKTSKWMFCLQSDWELGKEKISKYSVCRCSRVPPEKLAFKKLETKSCTDRKHISVLKLYSRQFWKIMHHFCPLHSDTLLWGHPIQSH